MPASMPYLAGIALLETLLNQYLQADPEIAARLESIQGKVIQLKITGLNLDFYLLPQANQLYIKADYTGSVDTVLAAPPFSFLSNVCRSVPLMDGEMQVSGDVETGQRLQAILKAVSIDGEAVLARILGDIAAHQASYRAGEIQHWVRQQIQQANTNTQEYLHYETRLLPTALELDDFCQQVDRLRDDAARLEARIQRLFQRLPGTPS